MIDEEKIRQIVQEMIEDSSNKNQFDVVPIPAHSHTGVDSNQVDASNLAFSLPYVVIASSAGTPTALVANAISVVNGALEICTGTIWVKVGNQT